MATKQIKAKDRANEKSNRDARWKVREEASRNVNDSSSTRVPRSRKLLADKQPDFPNRSPQMNDWGGDHSTRVEANAVVDGDATDEGEGEVVLPIQAQNDRSKPEGHVMSEVNPSIEGSDHKDEAGQTNVEIEDNSGKARRAKKRKAVAKDKNKVSGILDEVHENADGSKVVKVEPLTKTKPRKPPWNKGLKKKKKALAKGEARDSAIIAAIEERVHDENMIDCDEEAAENIVDNAANFGELNTDSAGLADDEASGVYNDRVSHHADYEHNIVELNTDVTGLADDEDTGVYNDRVSRDSDDGHKFGELNTDAALADDEDAGIYRHGSSGGSGDEVNVGDFHIDAAGPVDNEDSRVYYQGDLHDENNVGELHTDAAGVLDDEDAGANHYGDFGDSGNENGVRELNIDVADENNVDELNTDDAGVAADDDDTEVYDQGGFRDSGDDDNVDELTIGDVGVAGDDDAGVFHHGAAGDEGNVGELNEENAGVYQHGAFRDSGDEHDVGEAVTDTVGVVDDEDTEMYRHRAIRDASLQLHVGELGEISGVEEDEDVSIQNQAFYHLSDEPMGDAPGDPLDHSSSDTLSDLTSYSTRRSPDTVAKVIGYSAGYVGMELSDQTTGEPLGIICSDVKDVAMGEVENGIEDRDEDGQGARALSTAARRNRKRKACENGNMTANYEAATIDEKKVVEVKRVAKPKKPPRKRKAPSTKIIADTERNINHDDMKIEDNHQDSKPIKSSRKRKAPMGEISVTAELERERSNYRDFDDGKNDAVIGEPSTATIKKKSTRKQFWYYQPITDDEPKPVDMMQRDEQLGSKRASRARRSSGNNQGNEISTREHSVAAPTRDQKPKTFTRNTHKEVVTKKTAVAGARISRRRNSDNTSITKQIKAYPEDVSMVTDKLEAELAEEPQAEGQNTIGKAHIHAGSTPGFRDDKVERVQDQSPAFPDLPLNQGAVAITMEKPIRASKPIQRKRAPKKEKPFVQSDARPGALEVANKDQVTEDLVVASRPRKRKPPIRNKFPVHVESTSGLGEPGASIAANNPSRKRVPINTMNFPSPQDLSLQDEDGGNDASGPERATSRGADKPSQKPKTLNDGGLKNYAGRDSDGGNPKAPESGLEFSPGKKNLKKAAKPKVDIWDYDYLVTNRNSKLVKVDLLNLFQNPETWALLSQEELEELQPHFPQYVPRNDDNLTISTDWLRNDVDWRHSVRAWQAELGGGFFDPEWQKQAAAASAERAAGKFDKWKEEEFEEFWGQKRAPLNLTSS